MPRASCLLASCLLFFSPSAHANACTSNGSGGGNWGTNGTWTNCGGTTPQSADTVTITDTDTVTVNTSATIAGLTINGITGDTELTHSGTNSLTINGNVQIDQPTSTNSWSQWNLNGGTATVSGSITLGSGSTTTSKQANIVITSGTLNANGGITTGSGTGSTTQACHNIDMTDAGDGTINLKGDWATPSGTGAQGFTFGTEAGDTFAYVDDSAAQTVYLNFSGSYAHLVIKNTHSSGATLAAAVSAANVTGNLTVGDDTAAALLKNGGFTMTGGAGDTFLVNNNAAFEMTGASTYPSGFGTITYDGNSTVRYAQTNAPVITNATYGNLEIKPANASSIFFPSTLNTIAGNLIIGDGTNAGASASANDPNITVSGNVTINANATFAFSDAAGKTLTVGGSWTNSGTFNANGNTVTFNSTSTGKTINNGSSSFYDVTFDGSGGAWSPLTNTMTVTNDLILKNGTFDTSNGTANVTVNRHVQCLTTCGTINMTSANTFKLATAVATVNFGTNVSGSTAWTFYNLQFEGTSGTRTFVVNGTGTGTIKVLNDLTLVDGAGGAILDIDTNDRVFDVDGNVSIELTTALWSSNSAAFTIGGNFTNNGTFVHDSGTITFDDNTKTSTLSYNAATTFNNLTIATAGKAMKFDETDQTNVAGTFTVTGSDCATGRVFLDSSTNDDLFAINVTGSSSISYADVEDSNAVAALTAGNSTADNDNNTNWTVNSGACAGPDGSFFAVFE